MSGRGKAEDWASEGGGGERNQQDAVGEYDYNVSNTGVLYITEDMLRRYSDPLPPMRMRSLKIDGSRRDDKIRCVFVVSFAQSHSWVGEKDRDAICRTRILLAGEGRKSCPRCPISCLSSHRKGLLHGTFIP